MVGANNLLLIILGHALSSFLTTSFRKSIATNSHLAAVQMIARIQRIILPHDIRCAKLFRELGTPLPPMPRINERPSQFDAS